MIYLLEINLSLTSMCLDHRKMSEKLHIRKSKLSNYINGMRASKVHAIGLEIWYFISMLNTQYSKSKQK